jgi:hypothetical protein
MIIIRKKKKNPTKTGVTLNFDLMCHFNVNKELNLGQFPTCDNLIKKIVEK